MNFSRVRVATHFKSEFAEIARYKPGQPASEFFLVYRTYFLTI